MQTACGYKAGQCWERPPTNISVQPCLTSVARTNVSVSGEVNLLQLEWVRGSIIFQEYREVGNRSNSHPCKELIPDFRPKGSMYMLHVRVHTSLALCLYYNMQKTLPGRDMTKCSKFTVGLTDVSSHLCFH